MTSSFVIERLSPEHDRRTFDCGDARLNHYLVQRASQDVRRRLANCFIAHEQHATTSVAGYYSLAAAGISITDFPEELRRRLPQYPKVPAALIGRLTVDLRFRGQGLGQVLLFDAVERVSSGDLAAVAVVVEAKDVAAADFYRHHEFQPLNNKPMTFFLTVASFRGLNRKPR